MVRRSGRRTMAGEGPDSRRMDEAGVTTRTEVVSSIRSRVRRERVQTHTDAHRAKWRSNSVSELCQIPPKSPVKSRGLRGHADTHRCCGKSLIWSALVIVGVPY